MNIGVVVPAYNCAEWFDNCLMSVWRQDYEHVSVCVIDDASPDPAMDDVLDKWSNTRDWLVIKNPSNVGAVANIWWGITLLGMNPADVIFLLDGDDCLPHDGVLSRIAAVYEEIPDAWLTYGSYVPIPDDPLCGMAEPYPAEVIVNGSYRTADNFFNHPITFRTALFEQLGDEDLKDGEGEWFAEVYDQVLMYPMLELAREHAVFLSENLYLYNTVNPLSVSKAKVARADQAAYELMARSPRTPLDQLLY